MTAGERQDQLVRDFQFIEDRFERFQLIIETASLSRDPLPERFRTDAYLVPGCVSRVWIAIWKGAGETIEVRVDSESPALQSIASLFCRVYSGSPAEEILQTEPDFIERLEMDKHLTPTRLRGLLQLREKLVESVRELMASSPNP